MSYSLQVQIHVEFRPVQMIFVMEFNVEQLLERRRLKPGKIINTQKIFFAADEQPETVRGYIQNFNRTHAIMLPSVSNGFKPHLPHFHGAFGHGDFFALRHARLLHERGRHGRGMIGGFELAGFIQKLQPPFAV